MTALELLDLTRCPQPRTDEDDAFLAKVATLDARTFLVGVADDRGDDEPARIVQRDGDGCWRAGRYIGSLVLNGRRLVVRPRLGVEVVAEWLDEAFGVAAPPASARHDASEAFLVRLLARLWCRTVDDATRHGLPLLRLAARHEGQFVRGRLDVPGSVALRRQGRPAVASVSHDRSLHHPATRAIVCADRALGRHLGDDAWRTPRVRQVLPELRSAVGSRPPLPSESELLRVRYTPITLPFRRAALLSHRIARRLGYSASDSSTDAEGLLVDVAELWELFVLRCVRRACPPGLRVEHGTTAGRRDHLLRSTDERYGMGRLKPDVLVLDDKGVVAVLDAKYKRLADTRERPRGVDREDLYQLAAYAGRYAPSLVAALLYPRSGDRLSTAESAGPWHAHGDGCIFAFRPLPTSAPACAAALALLLGVPTSTRRLAYESDG